MVGEEFKEAVDIGAGDGINFHDAATVPAKIAVTVGRFADEPPLSDAAFQTFANVERLLFGVEAGHVRQRAAHHPTGRIAVGRLRHRNEWKVVLGFKPFQFDVIEEIPSGTVHLVETAARRGRARSSWRRRPVRETSDARRICSRSRLS